VRRGPPFRNRGSRTGGLAAPARFHSSDDRTTFLATSAGIRNPHNDRPFSEAMLFGLAGGVGIGIFSFYYEKEGFASFFIGGGIAARPPVVPCRSSPPDRRRGEGRRIFVGQSSGKTAEWFDVPEFVYRVLRHGRRACRPIMADFLAEAAETLSEPPLQQCANRYAQLGQVWSDLASAALPDGAQILKEAKDLHPRSAELFNSNDVLEEKQAVWKRLAELAAEAAKKFPFSEAEFAALRDEPAERVVTIHRAETEARDTLAEFDASHK
jgi:hypothetical protein